MTLAASLFEYLFDEWGKVFGIILFILITATDLPRIILHRSFGWLAGPEHKDWTKKPLRQAWLPIGGIFQFRKTKPLFKKLIAAYLKLESSKLFRLRMLNNLENKTLYQFASRSVKRFDDKIVQIVTGVPGVGKSGYVLLETQKLVVKKELDCVIALSIKTIETAYPTLIRMGATDDTPSIWAELKNILLDAAARGQRITPEMCSYMLNKKAVYFIVDIASDKQKLETLVRNFVKYVNYFHRNNARLKLIITSRITEFGMLENVSEYNVLTLDPLDAEIETYFSYTCGLHGIDLNSQDFYDAVGPKNSLLRFEHPLTRTPLFIDVTVFIVKAKGFKELSSLFLQSVGAVYKKFTEILFDRSDAGNKSYSDFMTKYRKLAVSARLENNRLSKQEIESIFPENSRFNLEFLSDNGFLYKLPEKSTEAYSFIHQTIVDILFVEDMVTTNDYSALRNENIFYGEQYETYLREELKNIDQYSELVRNNATLAHGVLDRNFYNILINQGINTIHKIIGSLLNPRVPSSYDVDQYLTSAQALIQKLRSWNAETENLLVIELNKANLTTGICRIVLKLNLTKLNEFVVHQIESGLNISLWRELLENDCNELIQLIDKQLSAPQHRLKLILFCLTCRLISEPDKYRFWFAENVDSFSDEDLKQLLRERVTKEIIFSMYAHRSEFHTRRMNRLIQEAGHDLVLIPRGTYEFSNSTVYNSVSIAVHRQPKAMFVSASNTYDAEMNALNQNLCLLWTFEQMSIAYALFEGTALMGYTGKFIGLQSYKDVNYEAFKEYNRGKLRFACFTAKSSTALVTKDQYESKFRENVIWREVVSLG